MIPANNLRIGNYVFYNTLGSVPLNDYRFENPKELCQVTGFDNEKVILTFADEQIQKDFSPQVDTADINISPVILTPQLIEIILLPDNFTITKTEEGFTLNGTPVKYLHQLQNMYFEATGNELQLSF